MSDIGRYRLLYARVWRHAGFRALPPSSRLLALYLLSGPQTNRLGLFHLSVATAADDLKVSAETIRKGLADVAGTFGWLFDADAGVFYIPSWWKWNPPQNVNHLKGNLKDLNEIPASELVEAFARNLGTLPETCRQTFLDGITQRLSKRPPTQEQELDQKQKQERASREEPALRAVPPRPKREDNGQDGSDELVKIARETLRFTNPAGSMEELIESFRHIARQMKLKDDYTRAEIENALAVALSERRQARA